MVLVGNFALLDLGTTFARWDEVRKVPNALHREACADGPPPEEPPRPGANPQAGGKADDGDPRLADDPRQAGGGLRGPRLHHADPGRGEPETTGRLRRRDITDLGAGHQRDPAHHVRDG